MKKLKTFVCSALVLIGLPFATTAEPAAPDAAAISGTVEAFHRALADGDCSAALALLASDAQILESGHAQSREEYAREHLYQDIAFAQAVPSTRSNVIIRQEGGVAWATATSRTEGTFQDRKINSAGTELMVLAKTADGWRIRAIHWSNHKIARRD